VWYKRNGITELLQRAPPTLSRAAISLGIGPHSSYCCDGHLYVVNGGSPVTRDDVVKPTSATSSTDVENHLVMETKLTVIEILKVLCSL